MKVLLTTYNSRWGVIVNPQAPNEYRHIISFESDTLKDEFINNNLFDGEDYKTLLNAQPETSPNLVDVVSATSLVVRVDPKEYQEINENINDTIERLLNKDFVIVQHSDNIIKFYTCIASVKGNIIEYDLELDVFFTYDIKDIFDDKLINIKQAMVDRFTKHNNKVVSTFYTDYNKNELFNTETIEVSPDNLFPINDDNYKTSFLNVDYTPDSYVGTIPQEINDTLNLLEWKIFYGVPMRNGSVGNRFDDVNDNDLLTTYNGIDIPYYNVVIPPFLPTGNDKEAHIFNGYKVAMTYRTDINNPSTTQFSTNLEYVAGISGKLVVPYHIPNDEFVIKTTYSVLPFSPLLKPFDKDYFDGEYKIDFDLINKKINIIFKWVNNKESNVTSIQEGIHPYINSASSSPTNFAEHSFVVKEINRTKTKILPFEIDLFPKEFLDMDPSDYAISNVVEGVHKNEVKSYFSPYRTPILKSSTKNRVNLKTQNFAPYLNSNGDYVHIIDCEANHSYLSENWGYWMNFYNYGTVNFKVNDENTILGGSEGYLVEDFSNYSLPTEIDAWEQFIIRNKELQNASLTSGAVGGGGAVAGLAATAANNMALKGIFKGAIAPSILTNAIGAIGIGLASGLKINQTLKGNEDIKNTPDKIVNNGSTLLSDLISKDIRPNITMYGLPELQNIQLREHFYKYGYNFEGKVYNVNNYLKTRYYFNHIEIEESFENVKLPLNAQIKQIINDTLNIGLTVWHYRDASTWKGIKNYKYENTEIGIL